MVLDRFERSLTLQNDAFQESLALSANSFREHYLSTVKPCDGINPKEFEHWLDDVQRLATLAKKSPVDVALATSRGSLHRHVRELHNNGSTWEAIKTIDQFSCIFISPRDSQLIINLLQLIIILNS